MPQKLCHTNATQHRSIAGEFQKKILENSKLEINLKQARNNGPAELSSIRHIPEGELIQTMLAANSDAKNHSTLPTQFRVKNPVQAAVLLLHATSLFTPQPQPGRHTIDTQPRQRGTSLIPPDNSNTDVIPVNQRGGWSSIDPLLFREAAAAPFFGPSALDIITNGIEDGIAVLTGDHHLHSDAITIASKETNQLRRHAIRKILWADGIKYENQKFSQVAQDGATVNGTNIVVNLLGPAAALPGRQVILTAHSDKIGEGSAGLYDNAVGCAALIDLAKYFKDNLPAGARLQIVFVDAEEQGLLGSRAFVQSLHAKNTTPDLVINLDLMGGSGREVYISASNSSHKVWSYAEDPAAARLPKASATAEIEFIKILNEDAHGFNAVQNEASAPSDHLTFQHEGIPAVGLSVVKKGESAKTANLIAAHSDWADAQQAWDKAYEKIMKLPKGTAEYNAYAPQAKEIRQKLATAQSAYADVAKKDPVSQRIHNKNDNESLYHSGNANAFVNMLKVAITKFMA